MLDTLLSNKNGYTNFFLDDLRNKINIGGRSCGYLSFRDRAMLIDLLKEVKIRYRALDPLPMSE